MLLPRPSASWRNSTLTVPRMPSPPTDVRFRPYAKPIERLKEQEEITFGPKGERGVWRTINGRKVFIVVESGESIPEAIRRTEGEVGKTEQGRPGDRSTSIRQEIDTLRKAHPKWTRQQIYDEVVKRLQQELPLQIPPKGAKKFARCAPWWYAIWQEGLHPRARGGEFAPKGGVDIEPVATRMPVYPQTGTVTPKPRARVWKSGERHGGAIVKVRARAGRWNVKVRWDDGKETWEHLGDLRRERRTQDVGRSSGEKERRRSHPFPFDPDRSPKSFAKPIERLKEKEEIGFGPEGARGVWRTINGQKIFIEVREGESIPQAVRRSESSTGSLTPDRPILDVSEDAVRIATQRLKLPTDIKALERPAVRKVIRKMEDRQRELNVALREHFAQHSGLKSYLEMTPQEMLKQRRAGAGLLLPLETLAKVREQAAERIVVTRWLASMGGRRPTVKLYRGVGMSGAEGFQETKHGILSSWTSDYIVARSFARASWWGRLKKGGAILEADVPMENLLVSYATAPATLSENEYVVLNRGMGPRIRKAKAYQAVPMRQEGMPLGKVAVRPRLAAAFTVFAINKLPPPLAFAAAFGAVVPELPVREAEFAQGDIELKGKLDPLKEQEEISFGPEGKRGIWRTISGEPIFIAMEAGESIPEAVRRQTGEAKKAFDEIGYSDKLVGAADDLGKAKALAAQVPPELRGLLTPTFVLHRTPEGEWTPERQTLHENMFRKALESYVPPEAIAKAQADGRLKPTLFLMAGGAGAGKTTAVNRMLKVGQSLGVMVSADDIKESLPEWKNLTESPYWKAAGTMVHEESSYLSKQLLARAMLAKKDIVFDATLKSGELAQKLFDRARKAGYEVQLVYVDADVDDAIGRSELRARQTGRWVPPAFVKLSHAKAPVAFADYQSMVDRWTLFHSAPKQKDGKIPPPVRVAGDGLLQPFFVEDQGLWQQIEKKAGKKIFPARSRTSSFARSRWQNARQGAHSRGRSWPGSGSGSASTSSPRDSWSRSGRPAAFAAPVERLKEHEEIQIGPEGKRGVWRTIGGRAIFIEVEKGESIPEAVGRVEQGTAASPTPAPREESELSGSDLARKIQEKFGIPQLQAQRFADGTERLFAALNPLPKRREEGMASPGTITAGSCYEYAGRFIMDTPRKDVKLIHGVVTPPAGPSAGERLGHGWIEFEDEVFDPVSQRFYKRETYYKANQPEVERTYTKADALKMMLSKKVWGPWHPTAGKLGPSPGTRRQKKASRPHAAALPS